MNSQPTDHIASLLEDRLRSGVSSDQIAELIAVACQGIDAALAPVLGKRGVAALFKRSLQLTGQTHDWLAGATDEDHKAIDVEVLRSSLAMHTSAEAAACGLLLLKTLNDLLMNLIGPSLTDRLLRSMWATFLSGTSARGSTP